MHVAILGPLQVRRDSTAVEVTSGRQRTLLAALAVWPGEPVPVERLARALWGEDLPVNVRRDVQTYVTRLRRVLGSAVIRTVPGGYQLDIDLARVDTMRFRQLLATAASAQDRSRESALLEAALALWRGPPLEGIPSAWLRGPVAAYLHEAYLAAVERWIDLALAGDRAADSWDMMARVAELAERHPLREPLQARFLLLLAQYGRRAEALACYAHLRRRLADELGVEPGPELRRIHLGLLRE
ncbi:AfsR/SARP family transcriptional regulator [Nonomuraea typhae]|uniref:AfsR/SARP family transcriptional regulator n=1 Tax=Nonomuraea typhae TaxID=2603600 RepID=UPI0015E2372C|nr:BTAD domain-containing putative transcriptional regulator [Nonomuraea typhae]